MDLPSKDIGCHRTGFTRKCFGLVASGECNRWLAIQGQHPQTGETFSRHDCIDNWTPLLLIENSKLQRETGAAVESFRNEMVEMNHAALRLSGHAMRAIEEPS
jgi:hypothetical protein